MQLSESPTWTATIHRSPIAGSIAFGNGLRNLVNTTGEQGKYNTAVGDDALLNETTGYYQTAVGFGALKNGSKFGDTAVGFAALGNTPIMDRFDNTAVGALALLNCNGGIDNVAMGIKAMEAFENGNENVGIGGDAWKNLRFGERNVGVGQMAGRFLADGVTKKTTGDRNVFLGAFTWSGADDADNEIVIGAHAIGSGTNTVTIGDTAIEQTRLRGNVGFGSTQDFPPLSPVHIYKSVSAGLINDGIRFCRPGAITAFGFLSFMAGSDVAMFGCQFPVTKGQLWFRVTDGTTSIDAMKINNAGAVLFPVAATTTSTGNAYLDPATGELRRSTVTAGRWELAGSWTYSANVANVDFTGLAGFTDIMVLIRNVTSAVSGQRAVRLSVDNGASFFSGASDYIGVAATGNEVGFVGMAVHSTAATAARGGLIQIYGANINGVVKPVDRTSRDDSGSMIFAGSTLPVNALRVYNDAGGDLTGGTILVYGRR